MTQAHIYFAGNDIISYTVSSANVAVDTNTSHFRSSWVNNGVVVSLGAVADPPADRITTKQFVDASNAPSTASNFWLHFEAFCPNTGTGSTLNAPLCRLLDSGGVARIVVRATGTVGGLKVDKRDAAGVFTNLFTATGTPFLSAPNGENKIDLHVDYSATGSATLYVNDNNVGTFSGDVTTDAATALAFADFSGVAAPGTLTFSEVIVSDQITINAGLWRLGPVASGTTQQWTGVVSAISKTNVDDTTYIGDDTNGHLSGWTTPTTPPTGAWLVQSVVQEARVAIGLAGPQHFDWYCRTADGTDHAAGASNAPATTFGNFPNYQWFLNPHTTAQWVIGDIAVGFNLGVKSVT